MRILIYRQGKLLKTILLPEVPAGTTRQHVVEEKLYEAREELRRIYGSLYQVSFELHAPSRMNTVAMV